MKIEEFFHRNPFVRLLIPFLVGTISAPFIPLNNLNGLIVSLSLFTLCLVGSRIGNYEITRQYAWLFGIFVWLLLFYAGWFNWQSKYPANHVSALEEIEVILVAKVKEKPAIKGNKIRLVAQTLTVSVEDSLVNAPGLVLLNLENEKTMQIPGIDDVLVCKTKLRAIPSRGNPFSFDYSKYMNTRGIRVQAYAKAGHWVIREDMKKVSLQGKAEKWRSKILALYRENGIKGQELAVLSALTLGIKEEIDPSTRKGFVATGTMHVLAVSGLHTGIIFLMISSILGFMRRSVAGRVSSALIVVLALWGYALVTGLSPSVCRASTMFSFVVIGKAINRHTPVYNSLAASAFLLVFLDPDLPLNLGFQLSYAAVTGIVFFYPLLNPIVQLRNRFLVQLWQLSCVSIAAQISTLPLSLYYFDQFPSYFIAANLVVIPLVTILLYTTVGFLFLSFMPVVSTPLGLIINEIIRWLNLFTSTLGNTQGAVIQNIHLDGWVAIFLMVLFFLIPLVIIARHKKMLYLSLLLILILTAALARDKIDRSNQTQLIVFNQPGYSLTGIVQGYNLYLWGDADSLQRAYLVHPLETGLSIKNMFALNENESFLGNGFQHANGHILLPKQRISLAQSDRLKLPPPERPFQTNVLIVQGGLRKKAHDILNYYQPGLIVLDSSIKPWERKDWKETASRACIPVHDVMNEGAYFVKLN